MQVVREVLRACRFVLEEGDGQEDGKRPVFRRGLLFLSVVPQKIGLNVKDVEHRDVRRESEGVEQEGKDVRRKNVRHRRKPRQGAIEIYGLCVRVGRSRKGEEEVCLLVDVKLRTIYVLGHITVGASFRQGAAGERAIMNKSQAKVGKALCCIHILSSKKNEEDCNFR